MKSELVEHSPVRKELKIEIPAETVSATYNRISNDYARYATLPGFRQGRAPLSLVRRRFKDEIAAQTLRDAVPAAIEEAIQEHNLQPLGEPEVHMDNADGLKELGAATITLHCHIEVLPQVEVNEYKGLAGVRRTRPFTDEDLEKFIDRWREEGATLEPVEERGAQNGDTVTAALQGRFLNDDGDDFNLEEVKIELGDANNLKEIDEALQGAKPEDEITCAVTYPADFSTQDLAGKEVEYTLKVNGLHVKQLPAADDAWAQSLDAGYESLAQMKEKVKAEMLEGAAKEAHERLRGEVFNTLIDKHEFEVPRALIEIQADRLLDDTLQRMAANGFDPRRMQKDFWRSFRESMKPQAERDVRGMLLIEKIAETEGVEATPEDIENYFEETANAVNRSVDEVREALTKDDGERSIAASLRNRKVLELLVEKADVTDGEWIEPGPPPLAEDEAGEPLTETVEEEKTAEAATSEG